ncbi:MAG: LamG-like jellyroll fold domain-containing protein [Candidatus Zixiibacteriota bacterium]
MLRHLMLITAAWIAVLAFRVFPVSAQVDTAWARIYNGPVDGYDHAYAIAVDRSGNVYVTGHSSSGEANYDYATIKYSPSFLVGYWKFDESTGTVAYDYSGYGNDGTIFGATYVCGKAGNALDFDGEDDNVEIPDAPSLDLTDSLTITMWFKPDSSVSPGFPDFYHLIGKWHGEQNDPQWRTGYIISLNSYATGHLRLGLGFGGGQWSFLPSVKDTWNAGQWYHVAATYNRSLPSGNVKIFIDGTLDSQYDESRPLATNTLSLFINIDPFELWHPGNTYFPGVIDEVKLYGRTLSEDEIGDEFENVFDRGDANGDGIVDVADVVYLVSYLYRNGPTPDPEWVGDCNCDDIIDVADIVYLVSYLYRGGPPPGYP